jgi:hypothetical protein
MFNKLFNRAKTAPIPAAASVAPAASAPLEPALKPPVATTDAPKLNRLEAFREEWEDKWETSHEVIEGNGGNTDWAAWTDAVKEEDKFFALTVPMPLKPE